MAWIGDSLRSAIEALNPFSRRGATGLCGTLFTPQLAVAAYLSSGMMQKVINVPASDRVRAWRDWQADKKQIEAIEAEEKRLSIRAKIKQAEVLRGIGGGALILALPGPLAQPVNTAALKKGDLAAVNVVGRWQLSLVDINDNMADLEYAQPRMFRINGGTTAQQDIHPSRVVCFCGDPLPTGLGVSAEDAFWGLSRLQRVVNDVNKSDNASLWFSELVKKAKLLRIGIPDLDAMDQDRITRRVALISEGEGILNATVYRSSKTQDDQGEKIDDYQITWAGIPEIMDAFDQRVAAVADIPFTRLMGRSPAGMNATGQHDTDNWDKAVGAGQDLETRPCMEKLDASLLPSAGVPAASVTWRFAPLSTPTEAEEATTFDKTMDAVTKLQNTGAIPEEAFAKGLQNLMSEREYMPGLDQALAEIPETERYTINQEPDPLGLDPSQLQAANENTIGAMKAKGAINADQVLMLLADAAPRTLYVSRQLLNAAEFIAWAKEQGFATTTPADDIHTAVCKSRTPVDWMKMGTDWGNGDDKGQLTVPPGGARLVERLGDRAVVLLFSSSALSWRHEEFQRNGASFDFDEYQPHVTISYEVPADFDLANVKPYQGKLVFGPEVFAEIEEGWASNITEDERR